MTGERNMLEHDAVTMLDRTEFLARMKEYLKVNPSSTAVITIDLHRGHVDPAVATLPVPAEKARQVVDSTAQLLALARRFAMPVIHVILTKRPVEAQNPKPHRKAVLDMKQSLLPQGSGDLLGHNLSGSIQTQLHPALGPEEGDYVIDNKKTFSAFYGTDLDHLLRVLKVETVLLVGVNTNTCVMSSAIDAYNRGYAPVVVEGCVDSLYGDDLHIFALQNISRCIGWVLTLDEVEQKISTHQAVPVARS
jgi:nicotinamidase-related amidase